MGLTVFLSPNPTRAGGGGGVAAAQNTTTGRGTRTDKQGQCSAMPWQCGSSTLNALFLSLFTPTQKPCLLAVSSARDLDLHGM